VDDHLVAAKQRSRRLNERDPGGPVNRREGPRTQEITPCKPAQDRAVIQQRSGDFNGCGRDF
jgi:hypothetical protein